MSWVEALFSGLLQGVTEFLPVSSSGHLVIYATLFGEEGQANLAFTVFLHFATLLSVIVVFYQDILLLIREVFIALADLITRRQRFVSPERRMLLMLIIATIPAAIVGVGIKLAAKESILENIFVVGVMLILNAILMFAADRFDNGRYNESVAPYKASVVVGLMQACAILPGLSRSGSTIFGGLLCGFTKEFAVRFAFVLSIPAILGAGLLELAEVSQSGQLVVEPVSWAVGFVAALLSGILAISFIKMLAVSNKFYIFGFYSLLASAFAFLAGFGVIGF